MHIGIDFDNTIVRYDDTFLSAAIERGLLPASFSGDKQAIRDAIIVSAGEWEWTKLQAYVYGTGIASASLFSGCEKFLARARRAHARVTIVSHKSRFAVAAPEGPDLREAARTWLGTNGIDLAVFFEDTLDAKIARIAAEKCTHFIDDLEDVFLHPSFPPSVTKLLFRDNWNQIDDKIFGARV